VIIPDNKPYLEFSVARPRQTAASRRFALGCAGKIISAGFSGGANVCGTTKPFLSFYISRSCHNLWHHLTIGDSVALSARFMDGSAITCGTANLFGLLALAQ
jgi:hypothetical protein